MNAMDDETLIAYVDGELPPARAAEVRRALDVDPALARLVEGLQADRLLIQRAFEVAPAHPTEAAPAAEPGAVLPFRRRPVNRWASRLALPMAAALAGLVIGAGLMGYAQRDADPEPAGEVAPLVFAAQSERLQTLLEQSPSGTQVSWNHGGGEGRLTVVRTFQGPDGSYCREFTEDMVTPDTRQRVIGIACREGQAWQTKVLIES